MLHLLEKIEVTEERSPKKIFFWSNILGRLHSVFGAAFWALSWRITTTKKMFESWPVKINYQ